MRRERPRAMNGDFAFVPELLEVEDAIGAVCCKAIRSCGVLYFREVARISPTCVGASRDDCECVTGEATKETETAIILTASTRDEAIDVRYGDCVCFMYLPQDSNISIHGF
jgi:hypothetical protein